MKMIYTDDMLELDEKLMQLTDVFKQSQTLKQCVEQKIHLEHSQSAQEKIKQFLQTKDAFERIESYGKHAPDFTEKRRDLRQAKRKMDMDEEILAYRMSENDLQETLDLISYRLAQMVSADIKIDAGNPFFEFAQRGCGGSCHV